MRSEDIIVIAAVTVIAVIAIWAANTGQGSGRNW